MQVNSAMSSGLAGIQNAQQGISQATSEVAKPTQTNQAVEEGKEQQALQSESDKTSALVAAKESENQARASAEVVEAADETLGTVIDIKV